MLRSFASAALRARVPLRHALVHPPGAAGVAGGPRRPCQHRLRGRKLLESSLTVKSCGLIRFIACRCRAALGQSEDVISVKALQSVKESLSTLLLLHSRGDILAMHQALQIGIGRKKNNGASTFYCRGILERRTALLANEIKEGKKSQIRILLEWSVGWKSRFSGCLWPTAVMEISQ